MPIEITVAASADEIRQILALQEQNLARNISTETLESQGFVTVEHTVELLEKMNAAVPQTIAKDGAAVVGYALVMTKESRTDIPVLEPMFARLPQINYQGKVLSEYRFYVMGQICIAEAYRGKGVFELLYNGQKKQLTGQYDLCVTEVSARNKRSLKAHQRIGFQSVMEYTAPDGEAWHVLVW